MGCSFALAVFFIACNGGNEKATVMYTCPMPQDSVFSDKPGKCPKCGMDLVLMENHSMHSGHDMSDSSMVITKDIPAPCTHRCKAIQPEPAPFVECNWKK